MSGAGEFAGLSVHELGRRLRAGETDPVALTEYYLDRIAAAADGAVYISVCADRARAEAKESAARYRDGTPRGPLDGVPIAWKDLIDVAGAVTTCGSEIYRHRAAAETDAPIVANAAEAGMISLGKTNLTEFAFSGLGLNPHYGTPRNPHDAATARAPGGSSSGSAVAVAADLAPVAIGTDTGGSVRIPAAFNGLVGYKCSEGHIDKQGVQALALSLDTIGPIGRSVADCVLLERALCGRMVATPRPADLEGCRVLVPGNLVFDGAEDAVVANFEDALAKLSEAGVAIERRRFEPFYQMLDLAKRHGTLATAEAYYSFRDFIEGAEVESMDQRVVSRMRIGKDQSAYDLIAIRETRARLIAELAEAMDGPAFMAMPAVAITAPEIAPLEADDELYHATNLRALRNTMIGNFFNLCGFTIPSGSDRRGLPTGILINAAGGEDERLICYSLSLEKALRGGTAPEERP